MLTKKIFFHVRRVHYPYCHSITRERSEKAGNVLSQTVCHNYRYFQKLENRQNKRCIF